MLRTVLTTFDASENQMPIQLGAVPLAGFDRPLDMLVDCHRRIEAFLEQLLLVVESATGDGRLTEDAAITLSGALRYFAHAAPKHTQDEEESLFPRLRGSGDPRLATALEQLERLERDHDRADELHAGVDELGRQWLDTGSLSSDERARMQTMLDQLQQIYAEHIQLEDTVVFPLARDLVDAETQRVIGDEMRQRRKPGIDVNRTLAQLVVDVPARAKVFEDLGLEYCCSGNVPLVDVVRDKGLHLDAVVRRLTQAGASSADTRRWSEASIDELVDHIVDVHHAKLREELPHTEYLVSTVARVHGGRKEGLVDAHLEFARMARELLRHADEEERDVFPRLRDLPSDETARAALVEELVRMEHDHDEVAASFARLHELLDDFQVPSDACTKHRAMLDALESMERDLHVHVHLENHVLFPRTREQLTSA